MADLQIRRRCPCAGALTCAPGRRRGDQPAAHHDLELGELATLLFRLFDDSLLVARRAQVGYFSPSLAETEDALRELGPNDKGWDPKNDTHCGFTSAAVPRYRELSVLYLGTT